jgi:hypothetical protein
MNKERNPSIPLQNLVYGAVMCSAVNCADVEQLSRWLSRRLPKQTGSKQLTKEIKRIASGLGDTPLDILLADDLERIAETIVGMSLSADLEEMSGSIEAVHEAARRTLERTGLKVPKTDVFFVEDFPRPYGGTGFWAMSLDQKDSVDYGVKPGIYLKQKYLYPGVTEFLFCHELSHAVFSWLPSQELVRGLEEGMCDLLGLYACAACGPWALTANTLLNIRSFPEATMDKVYLDHLRQASAICNRFGFNAILELGHKVQKEGRRVLYEAEDKMILGDSRWSSFQSSLQTKESLRFEDNNYVNMERFCFELLCQPESYVLSPEAIYIGRHLSVGANVTSVAKESILSAHRFQSALKELIQDFYLVIVDQGIVLSNEAPRYFKGSSYRYEFKARS